MALSERIRHLESDYSSKDIDWVKYVRDHYKTIFMNSKAVFMDVNSHYWEHHRLEDYLASKQYDPNLAWIIFYINQISGNVNFKEIKSLLIPRIDTIRGLYQSYLQAKAHVKACRNA